MTIVPAATPDTATGVEPAAEAGAVTDAFLDVAPAPPADGGLRERKKKARRGLLVDVAQRMVGERGLDLVTVEMISAEAGVSPRTFFNYFETKDDAVIGVKDGGLDPEASRTFAAGGPSGRLLSDLQALVGSLLATFTDEHERMARAMHLMESEPRLLQRHLVWMDRHKAELQELFRQRREVAPFSADDELLSMLVTLLIRSSVSAWERSGCQGEVDAHLPDVVAQLLHVVASDVAPPG